MNHLANAGHWLRLFIPLCLLMTPLISHGDNPLVSHVYTADPAARVIDGRVYVIVTHDQDDQSDYSQLVDYYLFSSDDMVNWRDHGIIWNSRTDTSWANLAYAPDFIERNGRYYLYFPDGANAIGVAVADNPEGPYTDPIGGPLVDRNTPNGNVDWVFDPGVFIDDDGQAYLYFGGGGPGNARVIRLNNDMISTSGSAISIDAPNFFEALSMNKRNGTYYLTYSTDTAGGLAIDYMTSNNPTTGFVHRGTVLPNPWENNNNNNHQSAVEFAGQWYMFYHNRAVSNERGDSTYQRSINADLLSFGGDGSMQPVNAGPGGVPQLKYVDAFAINQAETFDNENGIETAPASEGTLNLEMGPGDWVKVTGVDFGSGATGLEARVAANINSSLEILLDDINSQPIATLQVSNTGGWQNWQTQSVDFTEVTGVHDVYLRSTAGHNLNWYRFTGGSGNGSSSSDSSSSSQSSSDSSSSDGTNDNNVAGSIEITNDWGGGYCAALTVTNNTSAPVEWGLSIAIEGNITNLWNGTWSQNGDLLNVSGAGWNNTLQPGQSDASIGFCADRTNPPPTSSSSSSQTSSASESSSTSSQNGDNLASNGGAESGLSNWSTTAGDLSRSTDQSRSGAASALISNRSDTWHGLTFSPSALRNSAEYDVSVWVKLAAGAADATLYLTAKREDDSDSSTYEEYSRVAEATGSASGWVELSGTYTHSGTPFEHFIIESDDGAVSYYADDFSVIGEPQDGGNGGVIDHDFFVGNITTSGNVRSDFVQYWDQITPENEGKWGSVETSRDVYNWNGQDQAYQYAQQNGIPFKAHTLVWGSQYPNWIDSLSPAEQAGEIEEWIRDYCRRYPETAMIDVVNESTPGHAPAGYAERAFGSDWIIRVFELARQYCPDAILILNDYNVLSWNNAEFIEMARPAVEAGVVDALGLQAHGLENWSLSDLEANLNRVADLGLPIYISEYDIAQTSDQAQLQIMQEQFPLFYNHPSVVGITLWGYVVDRTWVEGSGLIYDNGTPRPAMTWLMDYLGR